MRSKGDDSYLRLTLSELFLAKDKTWGTDRMPAVQASARLLFGRPPRQTFTTLVRPPVGSGMTVADIVARRGLPGRAEVAYLTLADLLSS